MIINEYKPRREVPKMSKYTCTADVMARALEICVHREGLNLSSIPPGILREAKNFFVEMEVVLRQKDKTAKLLLGFRNNPYQVARYLLARMDVKLTKTDLEQKLVLMSAFMKQIENARELNGEDLETASLLQIFFRQMSDIGSEESYNEMMVRSHKHMDGLD